MKKSIFTYAIFGLILLSSCENELNQISNVNTFKENAFTSVNDYRFALDGVYDAMKGGGYFSGGDSGNMNIIPDLTADNLIQSPTGRLTNTRAWRHEFGSDDGQTTGLYSQAYFAISRANFVLENLEKGILTPQQKVQVEAEARALRGIIHFDIAKAYCKIPTQSADANGSMGIAYVTSTEEIPRKRDLTVAQVYDKIIEDLEFAKANIPTVNETASPYKKGRFNKEVVAGLLSRVYLFKGDYVKALANANESIASSPSVGTISDFPLMWSSTNQNGILFEILNSDAEKVTTGVSYNQIVNGQIRSEFVAYKAFYDLYTSNDIRKSVYFSVSPYNGITYINPIKYNTRGPQGSPNVVNYKYLRTAEVYLNAAEAAIKQPTKDEVLANKLLNDLKRQRYSPYTDVTLTGQALLDEILLQRRLELFGESDRWFTLKRLNMPVQRPNQGALATGAGTPATNLTLDNTSFKWQWPIPKAAIDLNPLIVQNPGGY